MENYRQYRSNQGRSPEKEKSSYFAIKWAFIGLVIASIILFFVNGNNS